jgi:hypothetical protein
MSLRFYRRLRAGPFRMNVSKRIVSWSVGGRGTWLTFGDNRATAGLPGTGLYWTEQQRPSPSAIAAPNLQRGGFLSRLVWNISVLAVVGLAITIAATLLPR